MTSNFDHDMRATTGSDHSFDFHLSKPMLTSSSITHLRDMGQYSEPYSEPGAFEFASGARSPYDMVPSNHHHHHNDYHYQPTPVQSTEDVELTDSDTPVFRGTEQVLELFNDARQPVIPELFAQMPKNFFYHERDRNWVCYRRNYINVMTSFMLHNWTPDVPLYVRCRDGTIARVKAFSITLTAEVTDSNESRKLVQHSPQRDKSSEKSPSRVMMMPIPTNRLGNSNHVAEGLYEFADYRHHKDIDSPVCLTWHTFERIQFARATANNGKRPSRQQFYSMVVELSVETGNPNTASNWEKVAKTKSLGVVVRGRSPNHYKDVGNNARSSSGSTSQHEPVPPPPAFTSAPSASPAHPDFLPRITTMAPSMPNIGLKRSCPWDFNSATTITTGGVDSYLPSPHKRSKHFDSDTDTDDYCEGAAYPDLEFAS